MKILTIDMNRIETDINLRDTVDYTVCFKSFYGYNNTIDDICYFAIRIARKYGVDEIWINEDGVGMEAYDYLVEKRHTADGFALHKYKSKRLSLNE